MARRPGRPRSAAARHALLAATIAELCERGYEATGFEGIASRAGVAKTTIYRHWTTRDALVLEALDSVIRAVPVPDSGSTRTDLRLLMTAVVRLYRDPATAPLLTSLLSAMSRSPAMATAVRAGFVAARRAAVRTVLQRGVARGELRNGADLRLALDMLGGCPLYRAVVVGERVTTASVRRLVDVVLRGLAP